MVHNDTQELINRGLRLADVMRQAGWKDLVNILDSVVDEAVNDLVVCKADDRDKVVALHSLAHAAQVIRDMTLQRVLDTVQQAQQEKNVQEQQQDVFHPNFS